MGGTDETDEIETMTGSSDVPRSERIAVYPGTFDPLTNGHVDIIMRGSKLFDRIIVAFLVNVEKTPLFPIAERLTLARTVFRDQKEVEIDQFDGLLVDYARRRGASAIVRGLRAISDFEYEMQMAQMNRELWSDLETVFLAPELDYSFLSSSLVREVASLGGGVTRFVSPSVLARMTWKLRI